MDLGSPLSYIYIVVEVYGCHTESVHFFRSLDLSYYSMDNSFIYFVCWCAFSSTPEKLVSFHVFVCFRLGFFIYCLLSWHFFHRSSWRASSNNTIGEHITDITIQGVSKYVGVSVLTRDIQSVRPTVLMVWWVEI